MKTLQQLREGSRLSKAKLGRRFGVDAKTVWNWEHGQPVKPLVVLAYAAAFGVAEEDIDVIIQRYPALGWAA